MGNIDLTDSYVKQGGTYPEAITKYLPNIYLNYQTAFHPFPYPKDHNCHFLWHTLNIFFI